MNGIVQISCLGSFGRFGNSLFQYAAAKAYARKIGATLETPWWIGQELFEDIDDPPLSTRITQYGLNEIPEDERTNINLFGYFQHKQAFDLYTMTDVLSWFRIKQEWLRQVPNPGSEVMTHMRRGDYVSTHIDAFCVIHAKAYENAIVLNGYSPESVLNIVEGDTTGRRLVAGTEWLWDFITLSRAKVLFRGNSTFSLWAGALGRVPVIYSPVIEGLRGWQHDVSFVRGNHPRTADHPGVDDFVLRP